MAHRIETLAATVLGRAALLVSALVLGAAALLGAGVALPGASARRAEVALAASGTAPRDASLMLDFTPNAIHAGIYLALARHYDTANGVRLHVIVPGESADAIDMLVDRKVDFAILDLHDLAIADAQHRGLVGIMAVVERPLAAVIAQARYRSPRALAGRLVGVSGDPSDLAVLRSVVAGAGGDPARVRTITIGYDAVPDLVDGRVAAATAFWNDEGVELTRRSPGRFRIFRVEDYGAPPYPELVLCATRTELRRAPGLARGVVRALVEGYDAVLRRPAAGERALESAVSGLSPAAVSEQLRAELPALRPRGGGAYGTLAPATLRAWAGWEVRFGIVRRRPNLTTMFDRAFLPAR